MIGISHQSIYLLKTVEFIFSDAIKCPTKLYQTTFEIIGTFSDMLLN